ncbi:MAG TPA: putative Ig domain-containing protein, partial [Methylomirabilota bacterium]|nr:putative Ig domain-containing protein [Methylomirabilota bacterium]
MRNRAFLKVVLLGLLTFAFVPGLAGAASQGQDLTGMLASSAAERATAVSGAVINVVPSAHDFGRVNVGGSSGNFDFTVQNTGQATLNVSAVNHSSPTLGFSASPTSFSIPVNGSAVLHTAYMPTSGSGGQSDNVTLVSNADNGNFTILLHGIANNAPVYSPPLASDYNAPAFVHFSLTASATDQEGDALSWTLTSSPPLPVGATFDGTTGTLDWTPGSADANNYAVTVTVTDGVASTPGHFTLHVTASNNPPTANPGGPYSGVTNEPLAFNGTASSDPDAGQSISFSWSFG